MASRVAGLWVSVLCCACAASSPTPAAPSQDARELTCGDTTLAQAPDTAPFTRDGAEGPLPWGAPIRKLVVDAPRDVPAELVGEVIRSEEGGPLREETVRDDVRRLHALSIFENVEVHADLEPEGLTVRYRLTPRPRIEHGFVAGDLTPARLARHRPRAGELFDGGELAARRTLLTGELRAEGYRHAEVEHRVRRGDGGAVSVCLKVRRGPKFSIAEIRFDGARSVSRRELLASMDTREGRVNAVGRPLHLELFEIDRLRMLGLLYDRGFVNAEIDEPTIDEDPSSGEVRVAFTIREGDAFDVGDLRVTGRLVAPPRVYADLVGLTKGDRFSRQRILDGIEKIRELHTSMGQPAPEVVPESDLKPTSKTIDIVLRIGGD